jgi:hypothetical protein
MFEKASRLKLRFQYKGTLVVEDLWDLSVEELDSIYKTLNAKVKIAKEESLLETKTSENTVLDLQIEIIKYIVSVKVKELSDKIASKEKRDKKKKLMEILAMKQDADLQGKSIEEIQKMMDEL